MISVIIPTYNRAGLLRRAMESVLCQAPELELIVVDDGSTDATPALLAEMCAADPRIRSERFPERRGACAARNRGIELARGEYVAFHDSDDIWHEGKLALQLQQLTASGADVVFCAFRRQSPEGVITATFPHPETKPGRIGYEQLLFENLMATPTVLGKAECFRACPFDESFPRLQDWELALRLVQRYHLAYFDDVLLTVCEQPDSISKNPEHAVAALRKLYAMHREAINRSERNTTQMLYSLKTALNACGKRMVMDFLPALSLRRPLMENLRYVKWCLSSLIKGV